MNVNRVFRNVNGLIVLSVAAPAYAVDHGKPVGDFGANVKGAIAPMGVAHDEHLAGVHVAQHRELANEIHDKRRHIFIVEAIPGVVGCPQSDIGSP